MGMSSIPNLTVARRCWSISIRSATTRSTKPPCSSGAALMLLLALCPQLALWHGKGRAGAGAYFSYNADEVAYVAYVNALRAGRPRRNDPYTGRDERAAAPQPESLFSIQFIPPNIIATAARLAHLSAQTAFII